MILTKLKSMVMTTCAVLALTSYCKSMNDDSSKQDGHIRSILLKDAYEKQLHDQKMKEKQSHSKDQHQYHHHKSKHHHDNKEKK